MTVHNSERSTRRLLHTRKVICSGYARSDGLYDIEGTMQDTKADDSDLFFKYVQAGEPIHQMRLIMTIDLDLVIHGLEARTEVGPTPYCAEINPVYAKLVGLKIGAGFKKRVLERVGGSLGCTHLTELLGPMATTAFQATFLLQREAEQLKHRNDPTYELPKPWFIGACHAYRPGSEAIRLIWPETPSAPAS